MQVSLLQENCRTLYGKENCEVYGESGEEEVLVRIRPIIIIAEKDVAI